MVETAAQLNAEADARIRAFNTGATRSADAHRDDPEGFLSPLVLDRFNEYMSKHRKQADGTLRDSDNWQKGIPLAAYMKGMWRHFLHLWTRHRGWPVRDQGAAADALEDCMAMLFNVMGYAHELLKKSLTPGETPQAVRPVRLETLPMSSGSVLQASHLNPSIPETDRDLWRERNR